MKILHLVKTAVGAIWALRQMRKLVEYGVDVHVAIPEGVLVKDYQAAGITTHCLQTDFPLKRPWAIAQILHKFRQLVNEIQPDIIHSHFVGTTLTMRLALGKNHLTPGKIRNSIFCDIW